MIVEVKDSRKKPSARRLTGPQSDFQALGWPVIMVDSPEAAVAALR